MSPINAARIAIAGAGSWGCTLARLYAKAGKEIRLWSRNSQSFDRLRATRKIEKPIESALPDNVLISTDLQEVVSDSQLVILACSSQAMREVCLQVKEALVKEDAHNVILVSAAKGLELESFKRMSELIAEFCPGYPLGALSGPNLAAEILQDLPTASVIACQDAGVAKAAQEILSIPVFRVYSNTDLVGVELGGALKNVIAIAAGGVDGLRLGVNARAALITRGLAEINRLALALGGKPTTLAGLAGLGDLVATCSSPLSRNYKLGFLIAEGHSPYEAEKQLGAVAEGINTAKAACEIAKKLSLQMPIAEQVHSTLSGNSSPDKAIMSLMSRPLASE